MHVSKWALAIVVLACIEPCVAILQQHWPESEGVEQRHIDDAPWLWDAEQPLLVHLSKPNATIGAPHLHRARQLQQNIKSTSYAARRQIMRRCRITSGSWCGQYDKQQLMPARTAPRGDKACPHDCSGVGNCNYDSGQCECPAGWTGDDCSKPFKRPCTNRWRSFAPTEYSEEVLSHIDASGHDLNLSAAGWTASRCGGWCDADVASCSCGYNSTYRRIPAPPGSPYGTPPLQPGRQLGARCLPRSGPDSSILNESGNVAWADLYGPQGWCQAQDPVHFCGCGQEGWAGDFCEVPTESFCINQCSGHGLCYLGFCKCHNGWYGYDCSRKKAGLALDVGDLPHRPWLSSVMSLPPAMSDPPDPPPSRKRPFIYIYDLPPEFMSRMWQYRNFRSHCVYRTWQAGNQSVAQTSNVYGLETYLLEALSQSAHRTFDPEEADYFFVSPATTCLIWPVYMYADTPYWHGPIKTRPLHATNMLVEVKRWLQRTYPYWDRRGGRDHIWLAVHDEGPCWFPTEIYNTSIILSHWGRLELNHISNSAFRTDNYTIPQQHPKYQPVDWRQTFAGHACYTPGKDLLVPAWKPPKHFSASPLLGAAPVERTHLLAFKGDVGKHRLKHYSRGIRQTLYQLAVKHRWRETYDIVIGDTREVPESYSALLASSKYCLVAPGDGWSSRAEDSVLHGCIPVIIMDGVHAVLEGVLEYDLFSVRIKESSMQHLPDILLAISDAQLLRMQRHLTGVWHRFAYTSGQFQRGLFGQAHIAATQEALAAADTLDPRKQAVATAGGAFEAVRQFPHEDDAFSTIMQWLYARISDTR